MNTMVTADMQASERAPAIDLAPAGDPILAIEGITKSFGQHVALQPTNLAVNSGEFITLLGPSGCGKTTLLRIVAGLETPTAGRLLTAGQDVTRQRPEHRPFNMVFQSYALFPHLNVFENVAYGLRAAGQPERTVAAKVDAALEMVGLAAYRGRAVDELSGGMSQRVALVRAFVNEPRVLLLDEPLAALDLKLRQQMQVELKTIQREIGITFVFVTHDQDEALTLSDRVAIMNKGVIEQVGTPEDVYERPRTAFAAGFIGTSNLMTGTYAGHALEIAPGVRVPVPGHAELAEGGRASIAVRPEKIWMDEFEDGMVRIPGTVVATVYHGATTQYLVDVAPGVRITVLEQNLARARNEDRWADGDSVELGWKAEHAVVIA